MRDRAMPVPNAPLTGKRTMTDKSDQLGIYVDIGRNAVPRLNFTLGGHTTNVDIDGPGAAHLGGSLLTASFLTGMGGDIPVGTAVAPGQLPVADVKGAIDPSTDLPTLQIELIGGAVLKFVMSADVAAMAVTTLLQQVRAVTPPQDDLPQGEKTN
jgi:hypothetical protein